MFNWDLFFMFLKLIVLCIAYSVLIIIIRPIIFSKFYKREDYWGFLRVDTYNKIRDKIHNQVMKEKDAGNIKDDDFFEIREKRLKTSLNKNEQHQYYVKKVNKWKRINNICLDWLTVDELTIKSVWFAIFGWGTTVVAIFTILSVFVYCACAIPTDFYNYNHWEEKTEKFEALKHPTRKDCVNAENENEVFEKMSFITKEAIQSKKLIDTEMLWARLEDNISIKRIH